MPGAENNNALFWSDLCTKGSFCQGRKVQEKIYAFCAGGDRTEIGERGINISGGQQQRVGLARLVYSEASICLLDDPTSALDSVMAAHVFEECVHGTLERQQRTRVIVTNVVEPDVLRRADRVVWMDEGRIRACGPFDELAERGDGDDGGAFSALLAARPKQSSSNPEPKARAKDTPADATQQQQGQSAATAAAAADAAGAKSAASSSSSTAGGKGGKGGKLLSAEDRETGTVSKAVYDRLFISAGVPWVAATAGMFVVSTAAQMGKDAYIAYWTNSDQVGGGGVWGFLGVFIGLTLLFVVLTLLRAFLLVNVGYFCSIKIHKEMAHAVLYR